MTVTYRRLHPSRHRIGWTRPGTDEEYEIEVSVTAGSPGHLYDLPERCYPAEPPEVEVLAVADYEGNKRPDLVAEAEADVEFFTPAALEAAEDAALAGLED